MIVYALALLLFAATGLLMLRCRVRKKITFSTAAILTFLWVWSNGCGAFVPIYDHFLHTARWPNHLDSASLSKQAVIVLLGSGTTREENGRVHPRHYASNAIALSAQVYLDAAQAGATPIIIISGGDPMHNGIAEADNYAPYLQALGVPDHAIVRENQSQNTYQNAQLVAPLVAARLALSKQHSRQILLVTSASHMQRSLLDFTHFGMQAQPLAPHPPSFQISLWPNHANMDFSATGLHELIGIVQFYVYQAFYLY